MQQYIKQLLEDLKTAHKNQPPKVDYKALYPNHPAADPRYEGTLDYIIEWENAPSWKMDDLFGISANVFPPAEKLTAKQLQQLVEGIKELWLAFNMVPTLPTGSTDEEVFKQEEIPIDKLYYALLQFWKNDYVSYSFEEIIDIELCAYNIDYCFWGEEYCACRKHPYEDIDMDKFSSEKEDSDALPF